MAIKWRSVARRENAKAQNDDASALWNRARKAGNDAFYLRTTREGYDWSDPDPDGLLPTAFPKGK